MELFERELIICIKLDLTLNNLQRLIYNKTQANKQKIKEDSLYSGFCLSSRQKSENPTNEKGDKNL